MPRVLTMLSLSLTLIALRADAADASGKVTHNGAEMKVAAAVAVFDASSGFLEVHLLEQPPPAEEMARMRKGRTPAGRSATVRLYVRNAEEHGWVVPPGDDVPMQIDAAEIIDRYSAASVIPTPATLKGTLVGRIQPGEVVTLTAKGEGSSMFKKTDQVTWDVVVKAKILEVKP